MKETKKTFTELDSAVQEITHIELKNLKKSLGFGYASKLVKVLRRPNGKKYTENYIRRSLTMDYLNTRIFIEAVKFSEKMQGETNSDLNKVKSFISEQRKNQIS